MNIAPAAMRYADDQIAVIPIAPGEKSPRGLYPYKQLFGVDFHILRDVPRFAERYAALFQYEGFGAAAIGGRGSDGLFALDADTDDEARTIAANLHRVGLPTQGIRGKRGLKFLFKSQSSAITGERVNAALEIKADTQLIVLDGTIHPDTGTPYHWVDGLTGMPCDAPDSIPVIDTDEIDFLRTDEGKSYKIKTIGGDGRLNAKTRDYLRFGHRYRETEDERNNSLFKAASNYRVTGKSIADATFDLAPIASASGLDSAEIAKTIHSAYKGETTAAPDKTANDTRAFEAYVMDGYEYPNSRTRMSELSVLQAMVAQRAIVTHHFTKSPGAFDISARQLAEKSRLTHKTALKTVKRLERRGDIEIVSRKDNGTNIYRFSDRFVSDARTYWNTSRESTPHQYTLPVPVGRWCTLARFIESPLAEAQSIGKGAILTLRLLQQSTDRLTVTDIATLTGVTPSTARRRIAKLIEHGLAVRDGLTITATETDSVYEHMLAIRTGANRAENNRKRRHMLDRALLVLSRIERILEAHHRKERIQRIAEFEVMRQ